MKTTYILRAEKDNKCQLFWIEAESCAEAKASIPEGYENIVLVDIEKPGTVHEYFKSYKE